MVFRGGRAFDCVKLTTNYPTNFLSISISSTLPFSSTCGLVQLQWWHQQAFNALQCPIQLSSSAAEDWGNCHLQLIACFCGRSPPSPSKPGGNTATIYLSSKMHKLHLSTAHCILIFTLVLIFIKMLLTTPYLSFTRVHGLLGNSEQVKRSHWLYAVVCRS